MKIYYVPSVRLLWAVALVGVPAAIIYGLLPDLRAPAILAILGLLVVSLADGWLSREALTGFEVQRGGVARLTIHRDEKIPLIVRWLGHREVVFKLALGLPRELFSKLEMIEASIPSGTSWRRVDYACIPLRRGNWKLGELYLQAASRLRLWEVRGALPLEMEVRIYPNLARDRSGSAAVFLNKGLTGLHLQRMVGKGREFDKLRDYLPGDSFEDIHWKSTAKRRRPITKTYQIERTQEVYVVIDASRLSTRETGVPVKKDLGTLVEGAPPDLLGRVTLLERFVTSALLVALAAEKQGDLFGMVAFSDRVSQFVRARNGRAHYNSCRDALHALQPRMVSPDMDELAAFLRTRLRRRALLIFLTSLDDPVMAESFLRNIEPIARHHLIIVNMMNPGGLHPLFEGPQVENLEQIYEALAGQEGWMQLRETERELKALGVRFQMLQDEKFTPGIITQYLNIKQRQLI